MDSKIYKDRHGNEPRYDNDNDAVVYHREMRNAVVRVSIGVSRLEEMVSTIINDIDNGDFVGVDDAVKAEVRKYAETIRAFTGTHGDNPTFNAMCRLTSIIDNGIFNNGGMP